MTRILAHWTRRVRAALSGRPRTAPSPNGAAQLYLAGHSLHEIARLFHTRRATAAELLYAGLVDVAVDRLQQLLGKDNGEDWLDAKVTDYVDQDRLDADDALVVVALGVASDDAVVLACPGQHWELRGEFEAASLDLAESISIVDRDGGQLDIVHDTGRHEHDVDISVLSRCYHLTRWDRLADQEVT